MPNTGKPSKDCGLCRQRRVKCDLGRPSCQRCQKYGAECPGYRDQQDLMFRNANPVAAKKRKKRTQEAFASESSTPELIASGGNASSTSASPDPFQEELDAVLHGVDTRAMVTREGAMFVQFPLNKSLNEHWTTHSVPILLDAYSTLVFLNDMYSTCDPDGPLVWAAHLFARTYVTNIRYPTAIHHESLVETQRELGSYMGKTLAAVNSALQTDEGAWRDDVLATVWVLANYELLVGSIGNPSQIISPWHLHAQGMYSILKTRGIENLRTETGRMAFWSSFNIVQIQCILNSTECPPETESWLEAIRNDIQGEEEELALLVSAFMCKAAKIQCRMLGTLRRNDYETASEEYVTLVSELTRAESEADIGFASLPRDRFHALNTYWRNLYCACLVKCYHITHMMANYLTHHPPDHVSIDQLERQREYCLQRVRSAAKEILEFCGKALHPVVNTGDKAPRVLFDTLKLIWPLTAVYIIPSTLPQQKAKAEMDLHFIGREMGVRQALTTYPGVSAGRVPQEALAPLGFGQSENVDQSMRQYNGTIEALTGTSITRMLQDSPSLDWDFDNEGTRS